MSVARLVEGKTIVITGASRGIGAGLAEAYGAAGARLGLCARSPIERAGAVTAALDVADEAAVDRFARAVEGELGAIDLWINNAGLLEPIAPLRATDGTTFRRHLETNVFGVYTGCKSYLAHRARHGGGGVLVNISSGAGRKPYFGWSAYCAGKAAVDRMTECIALEERSSGLRAYAVAPGVIDTAMQELIRASTPDQFAEVERFRKMKADGRFSSTAWVAARLAELCFDPAKRTDDVLVALPLEHPP